MTTRHGWRCGVADRRRRGAGRRPAGAAVAAQPPAGHGPDGVRREATGGQPAPVAAPTGQRFGRTAFRRAAASTAARVPAVLAAGRQLRDLRDDDQRADRHPLHPGRERPRHADDGRRRPAGASSASSTSSARSFSGWLTDRVDPRLLLVVYYAGRGVVAAAAAVAAVAARRAEHVGLHRLLRPGLGGDGAADDRAVPRATSAPARPIVFGWVFASHQVGAAVAAAGGGLVRDLQGDYDLAFYLAAGPVRGRRAAVPVGAQGRLGLTFAGIAFHAGTTRSCARGMQFRRRVGSLTVAGSRPRIHPAVRQRRHPVGGGS